VGRRAFVIFVVGICYKAKEDTHFKKVAKQALKHKEDTHFKKVAKQALCPKL
jgi:hypothetical protein